MGPKARTKSVQNRKLSGKSEHLFREKLPDRVVVKAIQKGFSANHDVQDIWSPNVQTVFKALASARLCAAVWNNITDCDETYNYWEPEERFLYPIYPLFGLAAAFTWTCVESCLKALKLPEKFTQYLTLSLIILSSVISVSQIIGQYRGYHAPMDVFLELNRLSWESEGDSMQYNICVGKEWYRYPSSFFLPKNMKLLFVASEFRGQLPRPFNPLPNGTRTLPYKFCKELTHVFLRRPEKGHQRESQHLNRPCLDHLSIVIVPSICHCFSHISLVL